MRERTGSGAAGKRVFTTHPPKKENAFHAKKLESDAFSLTVNKQENRKTARVRVIDALDGQIVTNESHHTLQVKNGKLGKDEKNDVLKIVIVNRYKNAHPAVGYIRGVGLKKGAIASSVAHDSHNVVAVGVSDEQIAKAVNLISQHKGGICAVSGTIEEILPLPVAGLMSDESGSEVARSYTKLDALAKELGSSLSAPFMTLSFMALPVIPKLKMTDRGLFDGMSFSPVSVIL